MGLFTGDDFNNEFYSTDADDTFDTKGGDDIVGGGGGKDIFIGGAGKDTMTGGADTDTFIVGDDHGTPGEIYNGAGGNDILEISTTVSPLVGGFFTADFRGSKVLSIETLLFTGGDFHGVYFDGSSLGGSGLSSKLHVDGGTGLNSIQIEMNAGAFADLSGWTFANWDDNLSIVGTAGDEVIVGSSQRETVVSRGGKDTISTGEGDDNVFVTGDMSGASIKMGTGLSDTLSIDGGAADLTGALLRGIEEVYFNITTGDVLSVADFRADQFGNGGLSKNLFVMAPGIAANKVVDIHMGAEAAFSAANFDFAGGPANYSIRVTGDGDAETITGSAAKDVMLAGGGNDLLRGGAGGDVLNGSAGNDTLNGGSGNDRLNGGSGVDDMTGGGGKDIFDFNAIAESGVGAGNRDIIRDFVVGSDKIDVSDIDAHALAGGQQDFVLDTGGGFAAGEYRITTQNGSTVLAFNTNGDTTAEMHILLQNVIGVTGADLVL